MSSFSAPGSCAWRAGASPDRVHDRDRVRAGLALDRERHDLAVVVPACDPVVLDAVYDPPEVAGVTASRLRYATIMVRYAAASELPVRLAR